MSLYKLTSKQQQFLEKNIVDISGEINKETALYIKESFDSLELKKSPDIEVRISSGGGSVDHALMIYDCLRNYSGKTTGL